MLYKYILFPLHLALIPMFIFGTFQKLSFEKGTEIDLLWTLPALAASFIFNLFVSGDSTRFFIINKLWAFFTSSILVDILITSIGFYKNDLVQIIFANLVFIPTSAFWGYAFFQEARNLY